MTQHLLSLFFLPFCLFGCAAEKQLHLPDLAKSHAAHGLQACTNIFPQGRWQFIHSIDFSRRDGTGTTVLGVTSLAGNDMVSALVTAEGLTLFLADFHRDNSFTVQRAVPPFDTAEFAKGMMADIRALFQPPPGPFVQQGQLDGITPVCRYTDLNGGVVDILPNVDDCWQIRGYSSSLDLHRSIVGRSCRKTGLLSIPDNLELKTYGQAGYTLKMKLIRADHY